MPHPNSYGERQYIVYLSGGAAPIVMWAQSPEKALDRLLGALETHRVSLMERADNGPEDQRESLYTQAAAYAVISVISIAPVQDRRLLPKRKYFKTAALPEGLRVGLACSADTKVEGV